MKELTRCYFCKKYYDELVVCEMTYKEAIEIIDQNPSSDDAKILMDAIDINNRMPLIGEVSELPVWIPIPAFNKRADCKYYKPKHGWFTVLYIWLEDFFLGF